MKIIVFLFLISLSWNDIVAPEPFPNLTLMALVIFCLVVFMKTLLLLGNQERVLIPRACVALVLPLLLFFLMLLSNSINGYGITERLALYAIPFLAALVVILAQVSSCIKLDLLVSAIALGVFATAFLVAGEFLARYFLDLELFASLPRNREALQATVSLQYDRVTRPRGLSSEPGVVAFYFNCLGPLACYSLIRSQLSVGVKIISFLALAVAVLALFSPTPILAIASVAFALLFTRRQRRSSGLRSILRYFVRVLSSGTRLSQVIVFTCTALIGLWMVEQTGLFERPSANVIEYITGFGDGSTYRNQAFSGAVTLFWGSTNVLDILVGRGTEIFEDEFLWRFEASPINTYLIVLIESGVIGFIIFLSMIAYFMKLALTSLSCWSPYVLSGILAGALHCFVIGVFHLTFFPVLFGLAVLLHNSHDDPFVTRKRTV